MANSEVRGLRRRGQQMGQTKDVEVRSGSPPRTVAAAMPRHPKRETETLRGRRMRLPYEAAMPAFPKEPPGDVVLQQGTISPERRARVDAARQAWIRQLVDMS